MRAPAAWAAAFSIVAQFAFIESLTARNGGAFEPTTMYPYLTVSVAEGLGPIVVNEFGLSTGFGEKSIFALENAFLKASVTSFSPGICNPTIGEFIQVQACQVTFQPVASRTRVICCAKYKDSESLSTYCKLTQRETASGVSFKASVSALVSASDKVLHANSCFSFSCSSLACAAAYSNCAVFQSACLSLIAVVRHCKIKKPTVAKALAAVNIPAPANNFHETGYQYSAQVNSAGSTGDSDVMFFSLAIFLVIAVPVGMLVLIALIIWRSRIR